MEKTDNGKVAPLIKEYYPDYYSWNTYPSVQCAPFSKSNGEWGIFSNFGNTPIVLDGITFCCVEQLFQCLKFTTPEAIIDIYGARGMTIKHKAKKWCKSGAVRRGWGSIIVDAMKFCLALKYEQNECFREELNRSKGLFIVEDQTTMPRKSPDTWGCKPQADSFIGSNLMGRLLMELRDSEDFTYTVPTEAANTVIQILKSNSDDKQKLKSH